MRIYAPALVAIISTTGSQAFSPVSLIGQSQANAFTKHQPLFAEAEPAKVEPAKAEPPKPIIHVVDPPPPAPAAPAPAVTVSPPPAPVASPPPAAATAELQQLKTELKE